MAKPPSDAREYELARRVQEAHRNDDYRTVRRGDEALAELERIGGKMLAGYASTAAERGVEREEAEIYFRYHFWRAILGYYHGNPYFWSHVNCCLSRKLSSLVNRRVRQGAAAILVDDGDLADTVVDPRVTDGATVLLAKQICQAVAHPSITQDERDLFWWTVDEGTAKDYAKQTHQNRATVGRLRESLLTKVKAQIGELHDRP